MKIVQAPRASAILYHVLKSQANANPWLLPANICPIVPITFFKAGVPVEFVDISAGTLHMDLEQAEGRLERGSYGGVLFAHTYGEPSTPEDFFYRVKSRYPDLTLVDDRCLCIPETDLSQETRADVALYSTGYAKVVELDFGGYAFLKEGVPYRPEPLPFQPRDLEQVERDYKRAIRDRTRYVYSDGDWLQTNADLPPWYDYRQKIKTGLKTSLEHRALINRIYAENLPAVIQMPPEYQTWRFNIRLKEKERVLNAIFGAGLFASSHYASLAGAMGVGRCPQAENLSGEIINLFNDHHFDPQKAKQVCEVILETLP